jgi:type I restriction enzyme, S subunit
VSELPIGWAKSALIDLIGTDGLFADGNWVESKDQDPNGTIRLLQLADIGDGKFLNKSHRFVNDEKFELLNGTEVLKDDVLVARMPDPLGRACLMPELPQKCITVVDVAIVRPGAKSVSPNWLMYFFNSPEIRQEIQALSSGTTRKRISRSNLAKIEIPVPPLNEQNRIVEKLASLLTRVDSCHSHLERVPQIIKHFRQSVLAAATSGRLTEDWREERGLSIDNWDTKTGNEVFPFITSGSRWWAKYYSVSGAIFIRVGNLDHDTIELDLRNIQYVNPPDDVESERTRVQVGDILISITADIGMVAYLRKDIGEAYVNQHICLARQSGHYVGEFLAYYLASPVGGLRQLTKAQRGVTKAGLTLGDIEELNIQIPTTEEQIEIVQRVKKLFDYAKHLEAHYLSAVKLVKRLTPSILTKAFRGELVEQDPNDEPVEKLIHRIIEIKELEEEKRKTEPRKKKEKKMGTKQNRRPLYEILMASKGARLTPEQLFNASGYEATFRKENNNQEIFDVFYEELRSEIQKGRIKETRPNNKTIYLRGIKS